MRYRLRTLLIVMALLPAAVGGIASRYTAGVRFRKTYATRQMLYRLAGETKMDVICSHELPENGIRGLIGQLNSNGFSPAEWFQERRVSYPGIEKGIDAWGRELIVEIRDGSTIYFRSKGPNGIDEQGHGDDIQHSVDCSAFIASPPAP